MIVVVDYGMGNLRSVAKALESLGAVVRVSSDPNDIARASKLILPGVGAFGAAMEELTRRKLVEPITAAIAAGKPYLGICLGLQLLFEHSEEGDVAGLGVLRGNVRRFSFDSHPAPHTPHLKIPHIGWNRVQAGQGANTCPLLQGIPSESFFYFVHSYYAEPADRSVIALETEYGVRFTSMVWRQNLYATQFHPEKSQSVGLTLLKNFLAL